MRLVSFTAAALMLSGHVAFADQRPVPCTRGGDPRVGCFDYREDEVYRLWTAPEATILVKLATGETIDAVTGADVCPPSAKDKADDHANCSISAGPRGNFLFLKFWRCSIPVPLQMNTKTADGKPRMYNFEVHTEPQICNEPAANAEPTKRDWQMVRSAEAAGVDVPAGTTNLKYVTNRAALTVGAKNPILYSAKFRYPEDEADKRRETAKERRKREDQEKVTRLLDQEVDFATHDPWRGDRNYTYKVRGSSQLRPAWGWDNEYSTALVFPGMQTGAVLYRVIVPDDYVCKDDDPPVEQEQLAHYDMRGDTMIITGTAKVWRLRAGDKVIDICNLNYNPIGSTPGSGTALAMDPTSGQGSGRRMRTPDNRRDIDDEEANAQLPNRRWVSAPSKITILILAAAVAVFIFVLSNLIIHHTDKKEEKTVVHAGSGIPFHRTEITPQPATFAMPPLETMPAIDKVQTTQPRAMKPSGGSLFAYTASDTPSVAT